MVFLHRLVSGSVFPVTLVLLDDLTILAVSATTAGDAIPVFGASVLYHL
jgi:hypothetical protein